jgi:HSP20 family protein
MIVDPTSLCRTKDKIMQQTAHRDLSSNQISRTVIRVWRGQFGDFSPTECWAPPVNIYRLDQALEICVDIAGVDPDTIDVRVEPRLLTIRGVRHAPEPKRERQAGMRIIAMEIDHGPFCREIPLPDQVELSRVTSEYQAGLLWVRLPLRNPG